MLLPVKNPENKVAKPVVSKGYFFGMESRTPFFQAKLTVNQPGDAHEQEADRVAEQVMRMKEGDSPVAQRIPLTRVGKVMRMCDHCAKEEEDGLQRKETGSGDAGGKAAPSMVSTVLSSGGGQPMDDGTRQFMESRFGRDFSGVRIHTGGQAAESAQTIQAKAYTSGRDVVFGAGEYRPASEDGRRLLAHELAHVGQQRTEIHRQPSADPDAGQCEEQPPVYVKVHVSDRSEFGYGWLVVYDDNTQEEKFRMPIGSRGLSRDTTKTKADIPIGRYKVPNIPGDRWKNGGDRMAYGPNDRLILEPDFPTTRTDFRIHGGRQEEKKDGQIVPKADPSLNITYGCVRGLDANMKDLASVLNDDVYISYLEVVQDLKLDLGTSDAYHEALSGTERYFIEADLAKLDSYRGTLSALLDTGHDPSSTEVQDLASEISWFTVTKGLDPTDSKYNHKGKKN